MNDYYLNKYVFELEENIFDINFWWMALTLFAMKINDNKMNNEHDWDKPSVIKIYLKPNKHVFLVKNWQISIYS